LQHLPNNDLHHIPTERGKGLAGTTIIHLALFVLLLLFSFSVPEPPEMEEGILVNFGTDETGLGMIEPSPPAIQEEAAPPLKSNVPQSAEDEPLITQNDEEAPEVKKVDPEAEKRKLEKIEADRKAREIADAEKAKKLAEETERKRIEAEQKRQADIMNRTKNALANSKNAGTNSTSEGVTGGIGNQGVPTGSVDSQVRGDGSGTGDKGKGISYYLGGRKSQLLPVPVYQYQDEGKVVVEIIVDRQGNVTQATPGKSGSSLLTDYFLKVAKDAAMKAKFDADPNAPEIQKGTITYNFILK